MKEASIKCIGIKKSYGSQENRVDALKTINLEIFPGELTLLLGPSGSGKTTLISIIATILSPDEGTLILLDHEINSMNEYEKAQFRCQHLGIVFQSLFLIPELTVLENVALPLIIAGKTEMEAKDRAMALLKYVHLDHRADYSTATLSKGQQQRVAIARAMINESAIIICDEPTSSLDHVTGFEIMEFLHQIALNSEKVVLVVTHDPRIIPYGDRIISMSDGQITKIETIDKVNKVTHA